jgi:hypothetical protein
MTSADDQAVVFILRGIAERHQGLPVSRLPERVNLPDSDKSSPVDANELIAKFCFEVF